MSKKESAMQYRPMPVTNAERFISWGMTWPIVPREFGSRFHREVPPSLHQDVGLDRNRQ